MNKKVIFGTTLLVTGIGMMAYGTIASIRLKKRMTDELFVGAMDSLAKKAAEQEQRYLLEAKEGA